VAALLHTIPTQTFPVETPSDQLTYSRLHRQLHGWIGITLPYTWHGRILPCEHLMSIWKPWVAIMAPFLSDQLLTKLGPIQANIFQPG